MKKLIAGLTTFLAAALAAATTLTGTITYGDGRPVTGTLTLTPSARMNKLVTPTYCGGPGTLVPQNPLTVRITNGVVPANTNIPGQDCVSPANTWYDARLIDTSGKVVIQESWRITGMVVDLGHILPIVTPLATPLALNGDVTGDVTQSIVSRLQGIPLSPTHPITGQILLYDSVTNTWAPGSVAGTGTVTSVAISPPPELNVAGSPITSAGTFTLSWADEAQATVLSGPTGATGPPTFRTLVKTDIPNIDEAQVINLVTDLANTVPTSRAVNTTSPLAGGGPLSGDLTLTVGTFGNAVSGVVPASGGGTTNFLRADGTWAPAGAGSVSSVALAAPGSIMTVTGSPVTSSGTLTLNLTTQVVNSVWAGPSSGPSAAPTFRLLVAADIPNIAESQVTNLTTDLSNRVQTSRNINTTAPITGGGTLASDLTLGISNFTNSTAGAVPASGGGTTTFLRADATFQTAVTSVAVSMPAEFSVSGSPVTTTGTIAVTKANETANTVYAGPTTGSAAAPTFRGLVAADIPNIAESQVTNLVSDLAGKAATSTTIATTAPLSGGGDLSANRTFSLTLNSSGCLSATGGLGIAAGCITDAMLSPTTGFVKRDGTTQLTNSWNIGPQNLGLNEPTPLYGWHQLGGGMRLEAVASPGAPTVTPQGTPGVTNYTYQIVGIDHNGGKTLAGSAGTTSTGNATLTSVNYNHVTWTAVPGASTYDVLINGTTTSVATNISTTFYDDQGGTQAPYSPPIRNSTADMTIDGNLTATIGFSGSITVPGTVTATQYISNVSTGTAPLVVTSTTPVANLTLASDTQLPTISTPGTVSNSATTGTSANTPNTLVLRDGSGNFAAGTITGTLSGNATNVTGTVAIANGGTGQTTANAAFGALSPMTTTGDIEYESAPGVASRLAGNTTTTKNLLTSTGTGSAALAPVWGTLVAGDIPNIAESQVTNLTTDLAALTPQTRQIIAGSGLTGGGDLTADRTLSVPNSGITDPMLASTPQIASVANSLVKRDASGNFAAGTITANLTGNASGSAGSFTGSLSGDVTGTQSATVVGAVGGSTAANVHSAELAANAATSANTVSTIVRRDGSGNFSAGTITGQQFLGPATALQSATTSVDVSAATAPTSGQLLSASSPTAASWITTSGTGTPVGTGRAINTNSPLVGGNVLTSDLTLGVLTFSASNPGVVPTSTGSSGDVLHADGTWSPTAGAGTVTSVDLSMPAEFSVSGNPITGAGTLTVTKATESANKVFAGPTTGSPAAPTFRLLVAADIPNIAESQVTNLVTDLGNLTPQSRNINTTSPLAGGGALSGDLTLSLGTVGFANGGNGASTTWTAGSMLYSTGTVMAQDNANLFWDSTNKRLGLGINSGLGAVLHVKNTAAAPHIELEGSDSGSNNGAQILFHTTGTSARDFILGQGWIGPRATTLGSFSLYDSTASANRIEVSGDGFFCVTNCTPIYVGTPSPLYGNTDGVLAVNAGSGNSYLSLMYSASDVNNAVIGSIDFLNRNETNIAFVPQTARIQGVAEGSTAGDRGSRITFTTKQDGSHGPAEKMRLDSNGKLRVGPTTMAVSTPNAAVYAIGTASATKNVTLANGLNSDIDRTSGAYYYGFIRILGPSGAFSIGGFGGGLDGDILYVYNTTSQTMTIVNEDASSTAVNRITTLTGGNVTLRSSAPSAATFIYSFYDSRWILMSSN
jgi:hypothetical protein